MTDDDWWDEETNGVPDDIRVPESNPNTDRRDQANAADPAIVDHAAGLQSGNFCAT